MKTAKKPYTGTQAVLRAISLLDAFSNDQPDLSLKELTEATRLNRTTAYRILSALESTGLVAYNPASDRYRLGPELIVYGARALQANPLRAVARPVLEKLAEKTGEMASLEILEEARTLILDEVKGQKQRRMQTSVGNLWPANATSTGKVLLAHLPLERLDELLIDPLPQLTPKTIADRAALEQTLAQVREQGFATAINELEVGLTELSAPIFNHRGEAVAAISIGGPTVRFPNRIFPDLTAMLQEAAQDISLQLGHRVEGVLSH